MTLTYNKQVRTLDIRGVITLATGNQINITADDILAYDITESSGSDGLPLGTAEAASYALTISNVGKGYTPSQFDNAEVHMQVGIDNNGKSTYSDFGVWYVSEATAPEQSVSIDLDGYDALATVFEVDYADSESAYPTTLGSLATTICAASGISLKTSSFRNADIAVPNMPEWEEDITLRKIIGYIAACAGGFARIDRSGLIEIVSYADGNSYSLDSNLYTQFTLTSGAAFSFNALEVAASSDEDDSEEYTRYAVNPAIGGNPTNTIRIGSNPLFSAGVANSVITLLKGISVSSATVVWGGDPVVMVGDWLSVTATDGKTTTILIGSQSISFSGGLSFSSECSLPSTNTVNSGSYTSSGNVMDGNGNIKATRISNLDKSVISATTGHFEKLTASTVNTDVLLAKIIDAVNLKAQTISAESIITDVLTATLANIVEATVNKLNAGTIQSDELYAAFAELVALKVGSITADNITTDELATELARITVLVAGTAKFDKATVAHLVAEALNLNFGTAGTVFIQNLAVQYAQMVSAAIGDLCIKASDGNYYQIDVKADGTVSATRATVSAGEIAAGQTSGGRVILETNITAANLSTGNLLATYALVNRIDAARIDVDELFAREAFIDLLRTSKIIGDNSLEIIVRNADSSSRNFYQEDAPTSADYVRPGDTWTKPSSGEVWQAKDMSYIGLKFGLEGDLNFGYTLDVDDGSIELEVREDGCLYAEGIAFSVLEDGTMGTPYRWARVQDAELKGLANNAQSAADAAQNAADNAQASANNAQSAADEAQSTADSAVNGASEAMNKANAALAQADFERYVRTDLEGLHVGDNLTDTEVLIDSASVNVVVGGVKASTFSDKFVRIDNMQVRKVRGGLAISVYKGSV